MFRHFEIAQVMVSSLFAPLFGRGQRIRSASKILLL
jgi:hypothetical protein